MVIDQVVQDLRPYAILLIPEFDAVVTAHDVDPDDEVLVAALVDKGWVFNPIDDCYINGEEFGVGQTVWDRLTSECTL